MTSRFSRVCIVASTVALSLLASGCVSWVKVTPEGERIAVANIANVSHCNKVASVTVQGRDNYVGSMKRSPDQVSKELVSLARNQAATTSGDTIVASGPVRSGVQDFDVYRCR